jgi:hypothetical protein
MGLQALPTALLLIFFVFQRYIVERGDAENYDILTYFFRPQQNFFKSVLY